MRLLLTLADLLPVLSCYRLHAFVAIRTVKVPSFSGCFTGSPAKCTLYVH